MRQWTWGRRWTVRAVSFLLAAFAVLGGLAIQGHQKAEAYQRYLANSRRHAFAELSTGLNELDADLQKGIYATSPAMLTSLCTQIFGKAMSAQMALGELPYGSIELEQTAAFLAKTGDYAAALSRSAAVNGGCTEEEREGLRGLSAAASALSAQVAALQSDLWAGAATLEDVEAAEARQRVGRAQTGRFGKGVKLREIVALRRDAEGGGQEVAGSVYQTIESDFPELPSLIYDGPFSEHIAGRTARVLEGRPIVTQDEARLAAAKFLDLKPDIFTLVSAGEGKLPTYGFSAAVDGGELYVEVTQAGGLVMQVISSRAAGTPVLSREKAVAKAMEFLEKRGYPAMRESYFIDQGGILTINFAAVQDEVICYPDLVKVSIALDTGRVVGFESEGYLMNHTLRSFPVLSVSEEEARDVVSPALTVLSQQLSLIPTGGEYEVLCHEFKCRNEEGQHILVYVNAQTGQEEKILILLEDESGTLVI